MKTSPYRAIAQSEKRVPGDRNMPLQLLHLKNRHASKTTTATTLWNKPYSGWRKYPRIIPGISSDGGALIRLYLVWQKQNNRIPEYSVKTPQPLYRMCEKRQRPKTGFRVF